MTGAPVHHGPHALASTDDALAVQAPPAPGRVPPFARRATRPTRGVGGLAAALGLLALCGGRTLAAQDFHSETRATRDVEVVRAEGASVLVSTEESFSGAADVAEVLERLPELRVRRAGGLNGPAFVSIRGSQPEAVAFSLDGIPLHGAQDTALNINLLLPEMLDGIRVYRGNAPISLGPAYPGGMIDFRLREHIPARYAVAASYGSWQTWKGLAAGFHRTDTTRTLISAAARGSAGDFRFYDTGGTDFTREDDVPDQVRRNNQHREAALLVHHEARLERWRLNLISLTDVREHGIPGLDVNQAEQAEGSRIQQLLALRARRNGLLDGRLDLNTIGSLYISRRTYSDPAGEVGLGLQERADTSLIGFTQADAALWLPHHHTVRLVGDYRIETYRPTDAIRAPQLEYATRQTPSLGVAWTWRTDNRLLSLDASTRVTAYHTATRGEATPQHPIGSTVTPRVTPQAGVVLTPVRGAYDRLQVGAWASRTARPPGFAELYGDNGSSVGNPELGFESQTAVELSALYNHCDDHVDLTLQVALFQQWRDQAIEYIASPVGVRKPLNVPGAVARGAEARASVSHRYISAGAALARLYTRNDSDDPRLQGNALPWRSPWSADGHIEGGAGGLTVGWQSTWDSPFFADQENRRRYPARLIHDLTVRYRPTFYPELLVALELRNITNEREATIPARDGGRTIQVPRPISDFQGYPIPGRSIYMTLTWMAGGSR